MEASKPVILFDGFCNLCNGTVDFLLKHDSKRQFVFLSLQSEEALLLLSKYAISPLPDSVVYVENNTVYVKSDAVIAIAQKLTYPWKIAVLLQLLPRKMRNWIYDFVTHQRFRWFGRRDSCRVFES